MDILSVLSRGTRRTSRGTGHDGTLPGVKLPSAGTKTNPQLFHDQVRGQKRKRRSDEAEIKTAVDLPVVDFFAPKYESASKEKPETPKTDRAPSPVAVPAKKLSEDECRQLLRSHRLKITLMSKPGEQNKVKSSKKGQKMAAPEATKAGRRQLFPQPLDSISELRSTYGISRRVSENLVAQGYRVPTEVQLGSLPLLLRPEIALSGEDGVEDGVDFLAVAPTGSGKTISFLIPAINNIMRRRALNKQRGIHQLEAVIIVPTKELSHQLVNEGLKLTQGTGVKIVAMRKGMSLAAQQQGGAEDSAEDEADEDVEESRPEGEKEATGRPRCVTKADIVVTTPLVLLNFLTSGSTDTPKALPSVRDLILDEADVLLDVLFREQTLGIWTACKNLEMRVSCWSATMGSNIETVVAETLQSRAKALGVAPKPLVRLVVGLKDTAVPNIAHRLTYTASEQGKLLALRQLLRPTSRDDSGAPLRPPFLVFTQTMDRATALHEELKYDIPLEAGGASRIAALHSGLPDSVRAAVMRKFRAGEVWVLITTDVLARGVDFAGVNGVVNYDVPGSSATYVHRAGRTGRAGREGGVAVTFYTKEDIPFVKTVANVIAASERQAGKTGDEAGVQKWLLDALPRVGKADRKKLKEKGIEARRGGSKAKITSKSGYERRKEHNRQGAIEGNKRRREMQGDHEGADDDDDDGEWNGFGD